MKTKTKTKITLLIIYLVILLPIFTYNLVSLHNQHQTIIVLEPIDQSTIKYDFLLSMPIEKYAFQFKYLMIKDLEDFATVEFKGITPPTTIRGIYQATYSLQNLDFKESPVKLDLYTNGVDTNLVMNHVEPGLAVANLKIESYQQEIQVKERPPSPISEPYYEALSHNSLKANLMNGETLYTISTNHDFLDFYQMFNNLNTEISQEQFSLSKGIEDIEFDKAIIDLKYFNFIEIVKLINLFEDNGYTVTREIPRFEKKYFWIKGTYIGVVTLVMSIVYINKKKDEEYYQSLLT